MQVAAFEQRGPWRHIECGLGPWYPIPPGNVIGIWGAEARADGHGRSRPTTRLPTKVILSCNHRGADFYL